MLAEVESDHELKVKSEEETEEEEGQESAALAVPESAAVAIVTRKPQNEVEETIQEDADVAFVSIDDAEVILKERADLPCNHKVQVVLLPFNRDLGGVKLAFKGINLDDPTFQNELIHIDLNTTAEELQSD